MDTKPTSVLSASTLRVLHLRGSPDALSPLFPNENPRALDCTEHMAFITCVFVRMLLCGILRALDASSLFCSRTVRHKDSQGSFGFCGSAILNIEALPLICFQHVGFRVSSTSPLSVAGESLFQSSVGLVAREVVGARFGAETQLTHPVLASMVPYRNIDGERSGR